MATLLIRKCAKCPNQLSESDKALCGDCKLAARIKGKERRAAQKAADICQRCGQRPATNGILCGECHPKQRAAEIRSDERHRDLGLCEKCPNPVVPGRIKCAECLETDSDRRTNHLNNGLCRCGLRPPRPGFKSCQECSNWHRQNNLDLKIEVMAYYSNGSMSCACCGENSSIHFLNVDHIDGGGKKHLREIGESKLYRWLKKNNFPSGFQILCANCNLGKSICGKCPHQIAREQSGAENKTRVSQDAD